MQQARANLLKSSNRNDELDIESIPSEMETFEWFNHKGLPPLPKPQYRYSLMTVSTPESQYDRKLRMLMSLNMTCMACSMCDLGRRLIDKDGMRIVRDPHVFSNQNPTRFMVYGRNTRWDDVVKGEPFSGEVYRDFNNGLVSNGLSRNDFYIANTVRCYTDDGQPDDRQVSQCRPFVEIEMTLIKPLLVIALGEYVFKQLCPDKVFDDELETITMSKIYDVPVFAVYDPSSQDLCDNMRARFVGQMKTVCALIKHLQKKGQ